MPEVYWVAPDFDLSELPEAAEGFAYVEVDGVRLGEGGEEEVPEPDASEAQTDAPGAEDQDSARANSAAPVKLEEQGVPNPN